MKFQASIGMILMSGAIFAQGSQIMIESTSTSEIFACVNAFDQYSYPHPRCLRSSQVKKQFWCFPEAHTCAEALAFKQANCSNSVTVLGCN
ncbi:MAG: hypothetical protein J3R72DRAFT_462749, partial [Linnemannia gamsii]